MTTRHQIIEEEKSKCKVTNSNPEAKIEIATDVAASEFYDAETKKYDLDFKNPDSSAEMKKTASELVDYYKVWLDKYPLVSIEDPFDQDDWDAYGASFFRQLVFVRSILTASLAYVVGLVFFCGLST